MTESVPSVLSSNGNIEHLKNAKYKYDFVINHWNEQELQNAITSMKLIAKKCILAKEVGEVSGVPHIQGYVSLKKKERMTGLSKYPGLERASWRPCRNEKALIDYCLKDGNIAFEMGIPKKVEDPMIGLELKPWQIEICELVKTKPDKRTIHWYWESTGCVGKTTLAKHLALQGALVVSGKASDIKCAIAKMTIKPEIVIFCCPRNSEGYMSYDALEQVKDGMFFSGKYESEMVLFNNPHVIVFANFKPDEAKLSIDRWKIVNLGGENYDDIF
jgi:hypothetical protein